MRSAAAPGTKPPKESGVLPTERPAKVASIPAGTVATSRRAACREIQVRESSERTASQRGEDTTLSPGPRIRRLSSKRSSPCSTAPIRHIPERESTDRRRSTPASEERRKAPDAGTLAFRSSRSTPVSCGSKQPGNGRGGMGCTESGGSASPARTLFLGAAAAPKASSEKPCTLVRVGAPSGLGSLRGSACPRWKRRNGNKAARRITETYSRSMNKSAVEIRQDVHFSPLGHLRETGRIPKQESPSAH